MENPPQENSNENKENLAITFYIAEDREEVRMGLKMALEDQYPVSTVEDVENGQELVEKLLTANNDNLIITDNDMPKMTGIDAIRKIRETNKTVPIIMVTGDTGESLEFLEREAKLFNFFILNKPYDSEELYKVIKRMTTK